MKIAVIIADVSLPRALVVITLEYVLDVRRVFCIKTVELKNSCRTGLQLSDLEYLLTPEVCLVQADCV